MKSHFVGSAYIIQNDRFSIIARFCCLKNVNLDPWIFSKMVKIYNLFQTLIQTKSWPKTNWFSVTSQVVMSGGKGHKRKVHIRTVSGTALLRPNKFMPPAAKFVMRIKYTTHGRKIGRIIYSEAYVKNQFNPFASISKVSHVTYILHNKVYSRAKWSYTIGIGKFGVQMGTLNMLIQGNNKGHLSNGGFHHS